jgi:hypothetical protein
MTLEALASAAELHVGLVERFVNYGLLDADSVGKNVVWFDATAVPRLRRIERLRRDLGVNLPGVAVALQLLERIEALQQEIAKLRGGDARRTAERRRSTR